MDLLVLSVVLLQNYSILHLKHVLSVPTTTNLTLLLTNVRRNPQQFLILLQLKDY